MKTLQTLKRKVKNKYFKLAQEIYPASSFYVFLIHYDKITGNRTNVWIKIHHPWFFTHYPDALIPVYVILRVTACPTFYLGLYSISPSTHLRYSDNVPHFNWLCWVSKGGVVWMHPCWNLKMISIWILCFYWEIKWKDKSVQRQNPHKL